jgi:predicted NAD/FAD-binding protein
VIGVSRLEGKINIQCTDGSSVSYDKVILASHADQSLALLDAPLAPEQNLLKHFKYQENIATVHTDESLMPKTRRAWASWNYRIDRLEDKLIPSTIYWMNSLQGVSDRKNYFVSIADPGLVNETKVLKRISYQHPLFDVPAMRAQGDLDLLNAEGPLYFCGSYFKYGFHEDAYASAVKLCAAL